jgi:hypothetical protein
MSVEGITYYYLKIAFQFTFFYFVPFYLSKKQRLIVRLYIVLPWFKDFESLKTTNLGRNMLLY